MQPRIDLTGKRFGHLLVIAPAYQVKDKIYWECLCDCGKTHYVQGRKLREGLIKSCGCSRLKEISASKTVHGHRGERLYRIWQGMKQRTTNQHGKDYARYGGKGISVCDEWAKDYLTFREWALSHGYADDLSIDRIDNDKGYSPNNCRWATQKEQSNNRHTSNQYIKAREERN